MDEFKTPKGTKLPLIRLKGKLYCEVIYRVIWFREEYPKNKILVEIVTHDDAHSVVRATVYHEDGSEWANAFKREDKAHFADHLEKASTSAIGRALALCGYGTQFCETDFEELPRIVDAPVQPVSKVTPIKKTPPPQDSEPIVPTDVHGDRIIKFGALTGKKVSNLSDDEASTYCTKFRVAMAKGPIPKDAMDDFTAVKQYFGYDI